MIVARARSHRRARRRVPSSRTSIERPRGVSEVVDTGAADVPFVTQETIYSMDL